jgi:Flp pilus assembly protein TadG
LILLTTMVAFVVVPLVGLAIDGGCAYLVRLKLSTAVDGGSIAAARLLGSGSTQTAQTANAQATAVEFVNANFPTGFFGATMQSGSPSACVDLGDGSDPCHIGNTGSSNYMVRTVVVSATASMNTRFMGLIGFPKVIVSASGRASRRDVRVVLVMDRSSSMAGYYSTGTCPNTNTINDIALSFVNGFSAGRDQLGLVAFGGSAIVAYPARSTANDPTDYTKFSPPDVNFNTPVSPNQEIGGTDGKGLICQIQAGSNTGTAEALAMAYYTLRADAATNSNLPNMLNVIVLMTDGLPNGITAFGNNKFTAVTPSPLAPPLEPKATSGCTNAANGVTPPIGGSTNNIVGWIAQWGGFANASYKGYGFFTSMMTTAFSGKTGHQDDISKWLGSASDSTVVSNMSGCSYVNSSGNYTSTNVSRKTVAYLPDTDIYGNSTTLNAVTGITTVGGNSVPNTYNGKPLYQAGALYQDSVYCNKMALDTTLTQTDNACQIGLISWNAAVHQAYKIWNSEVWNKSTQQNIADPATYAPQPVIYVIGFDHDATQPMDQTLMQIIANDPAAPVSLTSRTHGKYYNAQSADAVNQAFQQIASQILRLSQ